MATGTVWLGDEKFTLSGTDYYFRFPDSGGALAGSSNSPFAPKSTSGERSYQDYDILSAMAFADLSGGKGQDRATDITNYYTAMSVDARGGRLILGPLNHDSTANHLINVMPTWKTSTTISGNANMPLVAGTWTRLAQRFTVTETVTIDRLWLILNIDVNMSSWSVLPSSARAGCRS